MPRNQEIKKVLVIGSGPIVIGQAAEFDYAGTQACRSLKEEGVEVVLVNSNPATIMTDKDIADQVYIEPLTVPVLEQIIAKEKPDSILPTLGGQAGLNLGMELSEKGILDKYGVKLIGTTAETIFKAEDRQAFKDTMEKLIPAWRKVAAAAVQYGVPAPAMTAALSYFDGYTTDRLPANLLQAQRDYFGAHTYERLDSPRGEFFHTNWTGHGGNTAASTYSV